MQKHNLFIIATVIMVVLALALPAPVFAQDPDPTDTPTEEPTEVIVESAEEPSSEALPTVEVAQYCTYDASTTDLIECSMWFTSVSDTIDDALGSTLGYGVDLIFYLAALEIHEDIYINGSTDDDGPIEVGSLTIQGSSSGSSSTILNGYIQVQEFITGDITVRGSDDTPSVVTEGLYFYNNSANITLENLVTTNNEWDGYSSIEIIRNGGDVTIDNVDSSDGLSNGLYIEAEPMADSGSPTITISNSTFSGNEGHGAAIRTNGDLYIDDVTVEGNWQSGLDIVGTGDINLNQVTANYNGQGTSIRSSMTPPGGGGGGCDGACDEVASSGDVSGSTTLVQVMNSTFNYNGAYGLSINDPYANVALTNVTASNNGYVDSFSPTSYLPYGTGIGVVNPNSGYSLTLNNVTANNNSGLGLYMFFYNITGSYIQANGNEGAYTSSYMGSSYPVDTANYFNSAGTELECAQFNSNDSTGVYVSGFFVSLVNFEALNNWGDPYDVNAFRAEITEGYSNCVEQTESPTYSDIVIEVMTGENNGSGSISYTQGLVFKLMEELSDGQKELLARVAIPSSAAPAGTTFTFTETSEGDPAALSAGMTYVGRSFTLSAVTPDGSQLNNTTAYVELLFKVDPDLVVPDGSHLAVVHYNEETGAWDEISTGFSNGYAYAYSALTGSYALVLVSE